MHRFTSEESGAVMLQQAISSAQFSHSGEYLCNVSVGADSSTTPFQLTVRGNAVPAAVHVSMCTHDLVTVIIIKAILGYYFPAIIIITLDSCIHTYLHNCDDLVITVMHKLYVKLNNLSYSATVISKTLPLCLSFLIIIIIIIDEFAFVKTPTSINISLGSSGLLACMPNNDIAEVWYKNGAILVSNSTTSRVAIGTSQVTITSVVYGDIGVYTCQAVYQNLAYQASARIDITSELHGSMNCTILINKKIKGDLHA